MKLVMKTLQQLSTKRKSIKMMKSQRSDTEKNNLIEEGKRISIYKVIKHNEIIII